MVGQQGAREGRKELRGQTVRGEASTWDRGAWGLNFAMETRVPVAFPRSSGTVLSDAFAVSNSNDKMHYLVTPNGCHLNTLNAHKAPKVRASQSSL